VYDGGRYEIPFKVSHDTPKLAPDLTSSLSREILRAQVNKREIGKQDTPLDKTGRPLGYR
jgi:hypothetical protein